MSGNFCVLAILLKRHCFGIKIFYVLLIIHSNAVYKKYLQ